MSAQELITDHLEIWIGAVTHKSSSGRSASGKNGKIELTGIKKLRELILELAVRGKLVEQDPSEEHASVLLDRIVEEKTRLLKEGKIKKPKNLKEVADEEKPFGLPEGWAWARMEAVSEYIQRGKGPKYAESGKVRVISQKCVQWSGLDLSTARFVDDNSLNGYQDERYIRKNDILWNSTGTGTVGRAIVVKEPQHSTVVDSHVTIVRPMVAEPCHILNYISSPSVQQRIEPDHENSLVSGSTKQVELNSGSVKLLAVPLPPLSEQHRIVKKVDELMAICDSLEQQVGDQLEAHKVLGDTLLDALTRSADSADLADNWARVAEHFDTLFTTEASIDKLKQTILQLAVMGRLVEQDPNDEPASVLLEKIAEEKDRLVKEEKIKKPKNLPSIAKKDEPFNLPNGWSWARVGDILSIKHGFAFKSNHFREKRTPYVLTTPGNFHEQGGFRDRLDRTKYYDGPVSDEFILSPADMIIPMTEQAPGLLGSAAFVPNDDNTYLHNQRLGKLIIHSKLTSPGFVYWFFNSQLLRSELARTCTGTTVRHTSPEKVKSALVPVTSLEEQHRIVGKVDQLMTLCDRLEARLLEAGKTRIQMAETVVEQAVS